MAYTILNARVKQKIATEAEWIAEEDSFGPILEGESAFVRNDDGVMVNFKIGDGVHKFSELPYFIAYLTDTVNNKILSYVGYSANITVSGIFRDKSNLYDVVFINNSGSTLTLNIGTTNGGAEIASIDLGTGPTTISLQKYFTAPVTLYFTGLTGKSFTMLVIYYQYDAHPAAPPTTSGSFLFPQGFTGVFREKHVGHLAEVWDLTTGHGKPGSGYDNCVLCGFSGTTDMANKYSVGISSGETALSLKGNANHQIVQTVDQMPSHRHDFDKNIVLGRSDNARDADVYTSGWEGSHNNLQLTNTGGGQPMNIQPRSVIDYWFEAVEAAS